MKRIIYIILLSFAFIWTLRIVNINSKEQSLFGYSMHEKIEGEFITVEAIDAKYCTQSEFQKFFHVEDDIGSLYQSTDGKIVCVCLEVTNISNEAIDWSQIMAWTDCGFETNTWASCNMGEVGSKLNVFHSENLKPHESQKIWYTCFVNPICFKEKKWNSLKLSDFEYVLSLKPSKIYIKME